MLPPELDRDGYIVGIHNYCDRWCERCRFTEQCRVYEPRPVDANGMPRPIDSDEFMDEVMHNFDKAVRMLHQMAKEHGLEWDAEESVEAVREYQRQQLKREEAISESRASKLTKDYMGLLDTWMDDNQPFFVEKCDQLQQHIQLNPEDGSPFQLAVKVRDALEVLRWYHFQILAKLHRALSGRVDELEEPDPVQTDANGSAKVAMIGLERSLGALESMRNLFPEKTDDWIPLMAHLQRTIRAVEAEFPKVHEFLRPGFDVEAVGPKDE